MIVWPCAHCRAEISRTLGLPGVAHCPSCNKLSIIEPLGTTRRPTVAEARELYAVPAVRAALGLREGPPDRVVARELLSTAADEIPQPADDRYPTVTDGPDQADVDALRELLDLTANFASNDQRARYLLSSDWMRERGAAAADHASRQLIELTITPR